MSLIWVSLFVFLIWHPASASELQVATEELRKAAFQLAKDRHFGKAAIKYAELRSLAEQAGNRPLEIQSINAIGGCYYGQYQYRAALEYYRLAHAKAVSAKNADLEGIIATNIASLYASLGEADLAKEFILRYPLDGEKIRSESRLHWFLLQVQVFSRTRDLLQFEGAKARALAESERPAPLSLQTAQPSAWSEAVTELRRAWVFDVLSDAYLDLEHIDLGLLYAGEAFRLRTIYRDKDRLRSLVQLCVLYRKAGHGEQARKISTAILDLESYEPTPMQRFRLHRERALALLSGGETDKALEEFQRALDYPRQWRAFVLPSDSAFLHFEQFMNGQVQEEFLEAMLAAPESHWTPSLISEAFGVAEEARFASLRAAYFPKDELSQRLGETYWPALREFESAQAKVLAGDRAAIPERDVLLHRLQEMEMASGVPIPLAQNSSRLFQQTLQQPSKPGDTIFSFYFGAQGTIAWTLTSKGLRARKIPHNKAHVRQLVDQFSLALRTGTHSLELPVGKELVQLLFGDVSATAGTWTVVVNDPIARLPLAALPVQGNKFLVEKVALRLVTSAIHQSSDPGPQRNRIAATFADPIYNAADPRLAKQQIRSKVSPSLQLNRLPMTATEASTVAHELSRLGWTTQERFGADASVANLRTLLEKEPGILHIAAHFGEDTTSPELTAIALSAFPDANQQQFFTVKDLTAIRTRCSLVVLSGCNSADGSAFPGIGLAGHSRAWIISGAGSVISTLWPVSDSSNPLLKHFYRQLRPHSMSTSDIASALQRAQLATLRGKNEFSHPKHWAVYTLLQRN